MALTRKQLASLLGLELIGTLNALIAFRLWDSRLWAATHAGLVFVFIEAFIFWRINRTGSAARYFTFWANGFQLVGFSLPMLLTRWMNLGIPFAELKIWGISGPLFHGLSEAFYCVLMVATVVDLMRAPKNRSID